MDLPRNAFKQAIAAVFARQRLAAGATFVAARVDAGLLARGADALLQQF